MAEKCLLNEKAFLEHYTYDPVLKKTIESVGIGIGVGGAVVGGSASVAATTGFVGWLSSTLGITSFATAAAATAATAVLPIAIPTAIAVGGWFYYKNRKKKKEIDRSAFVDDLAKEVGKIIFLPMIANGNEKILSCPENKDAIRKFIGKHFIEWGYKQEFADEMLSHWLGKDYDATMKCYEGFLTRIDNMKDDDLFNDTCQKSELPSKELRKFATELANKIS